MCLPCCDGQEAASHKGTSRDKVVCWGAAYREPTRATCLHEPGPDHPRNVYTAEAGSSRRAYRPPVLFIVIKIRSNERARCDSLRFSSDASKTRSLSLSLSLSRSPNAVCTLVNQIRSRRRSTYQTRILFRNHGEKISSPRRGVQTVALLCSGLRQI